jgi:4-hydroxy-2-oxoglutarate aldolase
MKLAGIFAPLTTPFAGDGSVAVADLRANMDGYNRTGLAGYVVLGSTGEAVFLSDEESARILQTAREAASSEKILIAGAGAESTAQTIGRTRLAADLGYAVALVKPPHYYRPHMKPQVLMDHFRRVADASRIPILLYSIPQFTGIALEAAEVAELAKHSNIIGIKESSGDVQRVAAIMAQAPADFQTLVGSTNALSASLMKGARGGILALACVLPELCVEVYERATRGDALGASQLQERLASASRLIVSEGGPAGVKCGMELRGYRGGAPRLPLQPVSARQREEISACLRVLEAGAATRA